MEKVIAEKIGCKVIERNAWLFIQYDNGAACSWIVENEITKDEAIKAIESEDSVYMVILAAQKRNEPRGI